LVDYIHMAEDIVIVLVQPDSAITVVFEPLRWYPVPKGTSSAVAQNTREVGNIGDFRLKSPSISETVRDRPVVTMER